MCAKSQQGLCEREYANNHRRRENALAFGVKMNAVECGGYVVIYFCLLLAPYFSSSFAALYWCFSYA